MLEKLFDTQPERVEMNGECDLPLSVVRRVCYDLSIHISQLLLTDSASRLHTIIYSRARILKSSEFSRRSLHVPLHLPESSTQSTPHTKYARLWWVGRHKRTRCHDWWPKSGTKLQLLWPMSRRFWLFSAQSEEKSLIICWIRWRNAAEWGNGVY